MSDVGTVVREAFGGGASVEGLVRLSGGASRETWALDVVAADGVRHPLVFRSGAAGLAAEARLMRAAREAGVPVPGVVAAADSYVLMERVEGETIPRRILRDEAVRPLLAGQCGEALAAIHRMPLSALPQATDTRDADAGTPAADVQMAGPRGVGDADGDPLAVWREALDAAGEPHPVFELALRRLAATRPESTRRTVVHGDFRNGNLVVGPRGVEAVLDWELAHAGDPLEDLGWLCVKAWRFGSPLPVGGFGTYDDLLSSYEKASGHPVDREALRWWETFGVLKWGVICVVQARRHLSGEARSVELAAIGRRVCENEWDLLAMLEENPLR